LLSFDVKPFGALVEYTLKPVLDDIKETLDKLEEHKIPAKKLLPMMIRLYMFDRITNAIITLLVTGAICFTALRLLSHPIAL
jgi:hypothetical protein